MINSAGVQNTPAGVQNTPAGQQAGPGSRIRLAVVQALARFRRPVGEPALKASGVGGTGALSQSSAPPLDLAYLWNQEGDRLSAYRDADAMDAESDLAAAALNAWAATATAGAMTLQPGEGPPAAGISIMGGIPLQAGSGLLTVHCRGREGSHHPAAQLAADNVFRDCHLAERAWTFARDTRKYGDKFMEVVVDDQLRVRRLKSLPPAEMIREEDEYGRLQPIAFRQVRSGQTVAQFAAWQIIHLRNNRQGDEKYGRSGLRTARRVWRMLSLLEDSLVSARLTRAYQKLVHFLPVPDNTSTEDRQTTVRDYLRTMTTSTLIDPSTGRLEQRENPASVTTDFFLTVAPGDSQKTGIQSLDPANAQISQIADMEYFQNLLVAGLEVPKAYLGLERDVNAKATLSYQEIHFLRQAGALQTTINSGIRTVLNLAFTLVGIDPAEVEVELTYGNG